MVVRVSVNLCVCECQCECVSGGMHVCVCGCACALTPPPPPHSLRHTHTHVHPTVRFIQPYQKTFFYIINHADTIGGFHLGPTAQLKLKSIAQGQELRKRQYVPMCNTHTKREKS